MGLSTGVEWHDITSWGDGNALMLIWGVVTPGWTYLEVIEREHLRWVHVIICKSDLNSSTVRVREVKVEGLLYQPSWMSHSCPQHILAPGLGACLSVQSEEDIDVSALGKQQPENISNPMYESANSAPPEPSYDPFTVSLHFCLGQVQLGGREMMFFSKSLWKASRQEKLTSRTGLGATSLKTGVKPCGCSVFPGSSEWMTLPTVRDREEQAVVQSQTHDQVTCHKEKKWAQFCHKHL